MTAARGIRNNNPGNIVDAPWTRGQPGYVGPEPEGRFATFNTMTNGLAALMRLLVSYRKQHGLKTVRGIINRWAPPVENDTSAYVTSVANALGVTPDTELPDIPTTYLNLAHAIAVHENGSRGADAITSKDYQSAAVEVFGEPDEHPPAAEPFPFPEKPERKMPLPAFAAIALEQLLTSIPTLIRTFGKNPVSAEKKAQMAEVIVPIAQQVIGASNEQDLVERMRTDPDAVKKIDQAVQMNWLAISEVGGGIQAARQFALDMTSTGPVWRQIGFGFMVATLALTIVIGGGSVMAYLLLRTDTDAATSLTILDYYKAIGYIVVGYAFGSSATSRKKDETIADLSR